MFAGPCGFNRSVERQQVGLVGNGADHLQHAADLGAFAGQGTDNVHRLADGGGKLIDPLQAAVDIDLALLGLGLGVAHFAGGVFGVLGHVLHAIGDFIDGGGHQFHLLRLLLAAVVGLAGVIAQLLRGLAQGVGTHLQLADHLAQLGGKTVEMPGQLGDFIAPVGIEAAGQVAFAAGDIAHGVYRGLQRLHDAAGDQRYQQGHDQRDHQADHRGFPHLAVELGLDVVHIHARADNPAPGFEQLDIRGLGHRGFGARLGPAVVNDAGTFGLSQDHEFVENGETVGVADGREVLAI